MSDELALTPRTQSGELELTTLEQCEEVIEHELQVQDELAERQLDSYFKLSMALLSIRENHLYLKYDCATYQEYCHKRWNWERAYANFMLRGAGVLRNLRPATLVAGVRIGTPLPEYETQVRPLTRLLSAQDQQDAWKLAVERAAPDQPTQRNVDDVVRTEFENRPTQAQIAAERREREAVERERAAEERAEQLLRERRDAERQVESLLKERDVNRQNRYSLYRGLLDAIRTLAWFHVQSGSDAWDGIANVAGVTDVLDEIERAQNCLTRLKREHPNTVKKPGVLLRKP